MPSARAHRLRWGKVKHLSWSFPVGPRPGQHGAGRVLLTEVSRRARRMLLFLLSSWCWPGEMQRNACTLSRPNPVLIRRAVAVRGEPGQPSCSGDGGSGAALISEHAARLSCGVAESRRWTIAP